MKKLLLLIFTIPFFCKSQGIEKIKIAFTPLKHPSSISEMDANVLRGIIENQFTSTNRFVVVDRNNASDLKNEKETQYSEDFIDGEVIELGKNIGAQFIVAGEILGVDNQKKYYTTSDGKTYFKWHAVVNIQIKVIDITTTQIIASRLVGGSGQDADQKKAMSYALYGGLLNGGGMRGSISKFIAEYFPVEVTIQEIQELDKKGRASTVLIVGGSEMGLSKGDRIDVKEITTVNVNGQDMERKTTIAELKIIEIEDEYFSVAKVTSGGDVLKEKFDRGDELIGFSTTNK